MWRVRSRVQVKGIYHVVDTPPVVHVTVMVRVAVHMAIGAPRVRMHVQVVPLKRQRVRIMVIVHQAAIVYAIEAGS